jgi:hypothetical protein
MEFQDIYNHVTMPEEVCLLKDEYGKVIAMRSQNRKILSGIPSIILEGAAIDPIFHGKGIYGRLLSEVHGGEAIICTRTQNPRIYAALQRYCSRVFPERNESPGAIREIMRSFAVELGCKINENGVIRGHYGDLFYDKEPFHERISPFFKNELGMNLNNGDALLVVGVK